MGRIALIGWSLGCEAIHEYSAVKFIITNTICKNTLYCAIYYKAVGLMGVIAVHNSALGCLMFPTVHWSGWQQCSLVKCIVMCT